MSQPRTPSSLPAHRVRASLRGLHRGVIAAAASAAALLAGCYVPPSVDHAVLQVTADGGYVLDGQALADAQLAERLKAKAQAGVKVVQIEASPQATMPRVRQAVAAVEAAPARVAFADGDTGAGAAGVAPSAGTSAAR